MAKRTLASTVAEWQSHFTANPHQSIKEYQIDWSTIRNNSEGRTDRVSLSTIHNFLTGFRAKAIETIRINTESIEAEEREELANRIGSDPVASILILQSQLGVLTIAAEKYIGQCKYINDVLDTTLSMLQENVIWSELEAKAAKLESELSIAQSQVESLKVEADTQKELRLQAVNKTVYGS